VLAGDDQGFGGDAFNAEDLALFTDANFFTVPEFEAPSQQGPVNKQQDSGAANYNSPRESTPAGDFDFDIHAIVSAAEASHPVDPGMFDPRTQSSASPTTDGSRDAAYGLNQLGSPSAESFAPSPPARSLASEFMSNEARIAAEEDKRRRNTAASARFRIKKKQREQALERTVKETQEKTKEQEKRIEQLEMENRWLKNLLVEKNTVQSTSTKTPTATTAAGSSGRGRKA